MKKKISNIVFIIIFMAMITVPMICMNTKENQISEIDNKILTEWPGFSVSLETRDEIEQYFNDRIGFREKAIEAYIEMNDKLFNVMVHPLFMYGKEGNIYYKDPAYITAYQRLNTDSEYLDAFVDYLEKSNDYLTEKNIPFVFFLCPDKKTIYPEYFPDSIHVNTDNESVIEYVSGKLQNTDIDYVIPTKELTEAKENQIVYNKLYDATHWNAFGAMIGHKLLDEEIRKSVSDIEPLSEDEFDLSFVNMTSLDVAQFPINEDVPLYTLKEDSAESAADYLMPYLKCPNTTFYNHYINHNVGNGKKILVFTDSYFSNYIWYYTNRFEEVYFVHRLNYDYLQYLVNLMFPDVVVFETAERSITGEMPLYCDYTDAFYEKPYSGSGQYLDNTDIDLTVTNVSGVRMDGNTLYLNPDEGDNIVYLEGVVRSGRNISVYAHLSEAFLEGDYMALHKESELEGLDKWSFGVQRRYLAPGPVEIIAVDNDSNEEYLLETFEVVYGQ